MIFDHVGLAIAGAASVMIPIAIFLLWRQRRRPVSWAAMRFLLEAYRKHRRRLQLEQLLLLLVRCMSVALIGFALARPLLKDSGVFYAGASRIVLLVVDNGLVSRAESTPGVTSLDQHRAAAREIVAQLGPGDRVGVVTASRPAKWKLLPPSTDHGAVERLLEELKPSNAPTDLSGAIDRLHETLAEPEFLHESVHVYLLSDFRTGSAALDQTLGSSLERFTDRVTLHASAPATSAAPNVQISSIEPARSVVLPDAADGSDQLTVRLARSGGELGAQVTRVRLTGEALAPVEPKVVEWTPGQTEQRVEFLLRFEAQREREARLTVEIDRDALVADDARFAVLSLRRTIRAVLIDRRSFGADRSVDQLSAGQWITRALEPVEQAPIELVEVEPATLDGTDLRAAEVAFLPRADLLNETGWSVLREFVDRGGLLIITPPGELTVHQWTDRLEQDLGLAWTLSRETRTIEGGMSLAAEQPSSRVLRMILSDLPILTRPVVVHRALPLASSEVDGEIILVMQDGSPLAVAGASKASPEEQENASEPRAPIEASGMVVYLAVSPELDWTNLPAKPLMVPLFQEIVRQGLSLIREGRPTGAGEQPVLALGPAATSLVSPSGARIPVDRSGRPMQPLEEIGFYTIQDAAEQVLGTLAVNIDPSAAHTDTQPSAMVSDWLAQSGRWSWLDRERISAQLESSAGMSPLTGVALAAVVILLLLETFLARRASHAQPSGAASRRASLEPTMFERLGPGGAT